MDLRERTITALTLEGGWQGVFGIVELTDGQVWAYGGTLHLGSSGSNITRVDGAKPELLYNLPYASSDPKRDRPQFPITHIVETVPGEVVIFSYGTRYESDLELKNWTELAPVWLRRKFGRPDAVSDYPAIRAVHYRAETSDFVLATALDGYIEIGLFTGLKRHTLPHQFPLDNVHDIGASPCGTIIGGYLLAENEWKPFKPSVPVSYAEQLGLPKKYPQWEENKWFSSAFGELRVVSSGKAGPVYASMTDTRPLVVATWNGKEYQPVSGHYGTLNAFDVFTTPVGALWAVNENGLWILESDKWILRVPRPDQSFEVAHWIRQRPEEDPLQFNAISRIVGENTPPWLALYRDYRPGYQLSVLSFAGDKTPVFHPIVVRLDGRKPIVWDALKWGPGRILLGTDQGACVLSLSDGKCKRFAAKRISGVAGRLTVDRMGRLWIAGSGLWMISDGEQAVSVRECLPFLGAEEIWSIAPYGARGVAIAIEGRGIAIIKLGVGCNPKVDHGLPDIISQAWAPSGEQAVIVKLVLLESDHPARAEEMQSTYALADEIHNRLVESNTGYNASIEVYGIDTLYFRGPNADQLAEKILPIVRKFKLARLIAIMRRYGGPGAKIKVEYEHLSEVKNKTSGTK